MKVRELMKALEAFDPEMDIMAAAPGESQTQYGDAFRFRVWAWKGAPRLIITSDAEKSVTMLDERK